MKRLITILSCILFYINAFGQPIVQRTNSTITVNDPRGMNSLNLFTPRYADTTAANLQIGIDTLGAVIYAYSTQSLWVRSYVTGKTWVEVGSGGGGGSNPLFPVTGTGTATGNVIGSLAGNILTVVESGNEFLNITPTAGSEGVILQAFNTTGGDNRGGIYGLSDNAAASSSIYADFNASADRADIVLSAASGVTSIAYSAGTHIFTGNFKSASANTWDLDGNVLTISQGGSEMLHLEPTVGAEHSHLQALNITDDDNIAQFLAVTDDLLARTQISASFNGAIKLGVITITSDATSADIDYEADTHTFTGNVGIGILPTVLFQVQSGGNDFLSIDPTAGNEQSLLQAFNTTDDDNYTFFRANTADDEASFRVMAAFNGEIKRAFIEAAANVTDAFIEYTADTHTFTGNILNVNRTLLKQGADVASAAGAIALGGDGNSFEITGTAAITLISNLAWQNGSEVTLVFTSTATLTDGTANSGSDIGMELSGNANFTASADDVLTLVLTEVGGTQRWREKSRSVN